MTLRADGRQWYGHGQASTDAAHEQLKEDERRARPDAFSFRERSSSDMRLDPPAYQLSDPE
jgi:hypothetical protein